MRSVLSYEDVLSYGKTNLHHAPTSSISVNTLPTNPLKYITFFLMKTMLCVLLMIRLLIYAFPITILSVRFIPFNFNHTLPRNFTPQGEMIFFILIIDPIDTSIILFFFSQELLQLNCIKCCFPRNTSYELYA